MLDSGLQSAGDQDPIFPRRPRTVIQQVKRRLPSASLLLRNVPALLLVLSACASQPGPGQVAISSTPPPGKSPVAFQNDKVICTRIANGNAAVFVNCMQRRGNIEQVNGPGGVPKDLATAPPVSRQVAVPQMPPAPSPPPPSEESLKYTHVLDRLVLEDSKSWALNQYIPGTMREVTIQQDDGSPCGVGRVRGRGGST